jgi:hypothetical protein
VEIVVDCREGVMAPLPSAELSATGEATRAAWVTPLPEDTTLEAACA